jgi:GH15 family glucan-1,4-alpha-glucosidase
MARVDGYAPIADYALIGDGRTAALVARDGAVDWLCLPDFDSPSVFGAMLDAGHGGTFTVRPAVPFDATRRYLPRTNILETTFATGGGTVRVTDAMTLFDERLGPARELVRQVEGLAGSVPMMWSFAPRFDYGARQPREEWRVGVPVATSRMSAVGVAHWDAGAPAWRDGRVGASFTAREGSRSTLALVAAHGEPLVLPARAGVERRLVEAEQFWRSWSGAHDYDGPWATEVVRSALVLKLLIFAPSGAAVAAPTTSLPEEIGGARNWDYRFCWIRDSAYTIGALLRLGCRDEALALFWWFMQATALTEPRLHVLYRLDGGPNADEHELPLPGYRGSRPVRVGNAALSQLQLDIYGHLLQTAWIFARGHQRLDRDTGAVLGRIADLVCDIWRRPDSSIWECRSAPQAYTHSKIMCWVALDRAIRLAREGDLPAHHLDRWTREAAAIHDFVERDCWSDAANSYTRVAGGREVDASLLTIPFVGYEAPAPRLASTIDAISRELRHGPYVYRYRGADGVKGCEGCFLNCSFWLAGALARTGRHQEAADLMDELVARANDVGLYAEEMDPETGESLGNFPQALVHLSLVDAALAIRDAESG